MLYQFLNIFLDQKDLLDQAKVNINSPINQFLLENNASQIEKIYDFFRSNVNLLYVNGFLGTGKTKIVNYTTDFLSADTIVLKYTCFNSTVLDDILLSFFTDFKKLTSQNIISEPKVKTENFTQKINSYFSEIEKPFVIILDAFESIMEENRKEILDFIFHLHSMKKVKIILIGKTFDSKYFENIPVERVTIFALDKPIVEKYFKTEKIKFSGTILDEFYKHSRGYYFFVEFSIKLMKQEDLSLLEFLTKLNESYLPFYNFLKRQTLKLIPPSERTLFYFLSLIRHKVDIKLLKKLKFYDEEKFNLLVENLLIIKEDSQIYVSDYFKEDIEESAATNILQKIRQYIVDLYLTQLPLRPLERDICISRQTMRKEIEYHKLFLPKRPKSAENVNLDINYLSYAKVFEPGDIVKSEEKVEVKTKDKKDISDVIDLTQRKNIHINLENLPYQSPKKPIETRIIQPTQIQQEQEIEVITLKEILEQAKQVEIRYHYTKAVDLYKKALELNADKDYEFYLPTIYTKLAFAFQKNADYENALEYYELAQSYYENANNFVRANYIKYNIAKIFYETYKIEKAKSLFLEIAESTECPTTLIIKSYLQLVNLEESLSNEQEAFEYCKRALAISNESLESDILSELYFKYALLMDDKNDTKTAINFYNKCISLNGSTKNKFLSPAYSNIATLYFEKNDSENAIINYEKAYEIDSKSNNSEGMYYSASKLATMLQRIDTNEALEYFNKALDCAKQINDKFYIISASLALGDFQYDRKQNEIALKHYMSALDLAQNNLSQDNINKINLRINDIKFRVGAEKFEQLVEIIRKQEPEYE